jgi:hypothetical protein
VLDANTGLTRGTSVAQTDDEACEQAIRTALTQLADKTT